MLSRKSQVVAGRSRPQHLTIDFARRRFTSPQMGRETHPLHSCIQHIFDKDTIPRSRVIHQHMGEAMMPTLKNGSCDLQLPLNIVFDYIGDFTIQNVAEPGEYIGIDTLDCAGAPFFHHLKPGIGQLGKAVAGNAFFFNQFFKMDRYISVGT